MSNLDGSDKGPRQRSMVYGKSSTNLIPDRKLTVIEDGTKGEQPTSAADKRKKPMSGKDLLLLILVGTLAAGNGYIVTCVQSFEPVLQSHYNYNAFTVST